ncbi:MAG: oligosaccharide flippase family protein [Ardenticatenales bacterium]
MTQPPGLGQRTVRSLAWNMAASPVKMAIMFARSILLANLLAIPGLFGDFATAGSIVVVTSVIAGLGIDGAFLNRTAETEDEAEAANVLFTLKALACAVWAVVLIAGAYAFASGITRFFLVGLTLTRAASIFLDTPRVILTRRVVHRRLVLADGIELVGSAIVSVLLALNGARGWALLGGEVAAVLISGTALMLWRPFWRPRWRLRPDIVRYYLGFGRRTVPARLLMVGTDRLDDLWTRAVLGAPALGLYSRAYRFAIYPRNFLVGPLTSVVRGTYAELKDDRVRLSAAFKAATTALVTTGFLFSGGLILTAPEIVAFLLNPVWQPIVRPFQIMMFFTLADPVRLKLSDMLVSLGDPAPVLRSYIAQTVVLAIGLVALGPRWGIEGVAMAVNIMAVVGMVQLARHVKRYVDTPLTPIWLAPAAACAGAAGIALGVAAAVGPVRSVLLYGLLKGLTFAAAYVLLLGIVQRRTLLDLWAMIRPTLARR